MIQQRLKGRAVSGPAGALIVLGLAVSIVLVSWLERALELSLSNGFQYFSFVVWVLIAAEVVAMMRLSVMEYRYTVADGRFFVERVYGSHARIVQDIPLDGLLGVGARDEVFRRFGNAQVYEKAVLKSVALPEMALAYRKDGGAPGLLIIQPDEAVLGALEAAIHENAPEDAAPSPFTKGNPPE